MTDDTKNNIPEIRDETKLSSGEKKAARNDLGISRTIYAAGYSFRDLFAWGTASFAAMLGIFWAGNRFNVKAIQWVAHQTERIHNAWSKIKEKMGLRGPVGSVAFIASSLIGHIAMAPAGKRGWEEASGAIHKYNQLQDVNAQLVESGKLLKEENDRLQTALAKASKSHREQVISSMTTDTSPGLT